MSDKYFVDTNILVYAHDRTAGPKHQRAKALIEQLWRSGEGVVSKQVLQELCVSLRRKATVPLPIDEVRQLVQDYLSWEVVVNQPEAIVQALELEARFKLSFWDALIIHAATVSDAAILYSADLSDGQKYGTVTVENPFRG